MDNDPTAGLSDSSAPIEAFPVMVDGIFNPEFFHYLQNLYQSRTGYHLILSDLNGSIQMGLPDCDKFPCMHSCRECREQIISEALRTGKVCLDACHEGFVIWGLPMAHEGQTIGGLIVIGGELKNEGESQAFTDACDCLYDLMSEHGLLPDGNSTCSSKPGIVHRYVHRKTFSGLDKVMEQHAKQLINSLQLGEFPLARKHFEEIKSAFLQDKDLPDDLLKGLFSKLVFRTQTLFVESGFDSYACLSEAGHLTELMSRARTRNQMENGLDAYYTRFSRLALQRPKDADDLLIEKATTYLEEHLRDELTREKVATAVGISPSHFSRLIRVKKGRTFTDLLNQYRVEEAARLIVRSSKSLARISDEVGFCDQSYFSKVFRKYKGISPAKYKSTHQL